MTTTNRLFDKFTVFCDQCENENLTIKVHGTTKRTEQSLQMICRNCGITETLFPKATGKRKKKAETNDHKKRGPAKAI